MIPDRLYSDLINRLNNDLIVFDQEDGQYIQVHDQDALKEKYSSDRYLKGNQITQIFENQVLNNQRDTLLRNFDFFKNVMHHTSSVETVTQDQFEAMIKHVNDLAKVQRLLPQLKQAFRQSNSDRNILQQLEVRNRITALQILTQDPDLSVDWRHYFYNSPLISEIREEPVISNRIDLCLQAAKIHQEAAEMLPQNFSSLQIDKAPLDKQFQLYREIGQHGPETTNTLVEFIALKEKVQQIHDSEERFNFYCELANQGEWGAHYLMENFRDLDLAELDKKKLIHLCGVMVQQGGKNAAEEVYRRIDWGLLTLKDAPADARMKLAVELFLKLDTRYLYSIERVYDEFGITNRDHFKKCIQLARISDDVKRDMQQNLIRYENNPETLIASCGEFARTDGKIANHLMDNLASLKLKQASDETRNSLLIALIRHSDHISSKLISTSLKMPKEFRFQLLKEIVQRGEREALQIIDRAPFDLKRDETISLFSAIAEGGIHAANSLMRDFDRFNLGELSRNEKLTLGHAIAGQSTSQLNPEGNNYDVGTSVSLLYSISNWSDDELLIVAKYFINRGNLGDLAEQFTDFPTNSEKIRRRLGLLALSLPTLNLSEVGLKKLTQNMARITPLIPLFVQGEGDVEDVSKFINQNPKLRCLDFFAQKIAEKPQEQRQPLCRWLAFSAAVLEVLDDMDLSLIAESSILDDLFNYQNPVMRNRLTYQLLELIEQHTQKLQDLERERKSLAILNQMIKPLKTEMKEQTLQKLSQSLMQINFTDQTTRKELFSYLSSLKGKEHQSYQGKNPAIYKLADVIGEVSRQKPSERYEKLIEALGKFMNNCPEDFQLNTRLQNSRAPFFLFIPPTFLPLVEPLDLKDTKRLTAILTFFMEIQDDATFATEELKNVRTALSSIYEKKKGKEFIDEVTLLTSILRIFGKESFLKSVEGNPEKIFEERFTASFDINDRANVCKNYKKTFAQFRNPGALFIYLSSVQRMNEKKEVKQILNEYVNAVLEGNFPRCRYDFSHNPHLEFINTHHSGVIENWVKAASSQKFNGYEISESDDPCDLLLIGTEVNSCQKVDGFPSLNKCLPGYLMNGEVKAIVVKKDNKIVARRILRLGLDSSSNPILFQEKIYTNRKQDSTIGDEINRWTRKKAELMNLPLFEGGGFDGKVRFLSSRAPFVYSDASEGGQSGAFNISGKKI